MSVIRHLQIVVPGEPCGKGRPRFVRSTGHAFTPGKTVNAETLIKELFAQAYPGFVPLDCALKAMVFAYMGIPASWSTKRKLAGLRALVKPQEPRSLDACLKASSTHSIKFIFDATDWQKESNSNWLHDGRSDIRPAVCIPITTPRAKAGPEDAPTCSNARMISGRVSGRNSMKLLSGLSAQPRCASCRNYRLKRVV